MIVRAKIADIKEEIELWNRYPLLHELNPSLVPGVFFLLLSRDSNQEIKYTAS